jgi:hypothetical protein
MKAQIGHIALAVSAIIPLALLIPTSQVSVLFLHKESNAQSLS